MGPVLQIAENDSVGRVPRRWPKRRQPEGRVPDAVEAATGPPPDPSPVTFWSAGGLTGGSRPVYKLPHQGFPGLSLPRPPVLGEENGSGSPGGSVRRALSGLGHGRKGQQGSGRVRTPAFPSLAPKPVCLTRRGTGASGDPRLLLPAVETGQRNGTLEQDALKPAR